MLHSLPDPILNSSEASESLKTGVRYTIMRLNKLDAKGMVQYYWSAIVGTPNSMEFAKKMKNEGFVRFEDPDTLEEFRSRFNDAWLRT